jgi:hypothetical protein
VPSSATIYNLPVLAGAACSIWNAAYFDMVCIVGLTRGGVMEEELRQETLEPGQSRTFDDLYDSQGRPVRFRVIVSECPPAGLSYIPGTWSQISGPPDPTRNDPPARSDIVRLLHEQFAVPHLGMMWVTRDRGLLAIEPQAGVTVPDRLRHVTPEILVQSTTLHPTVGAGNRFEVDLDPKVPVESSTRALLMSFRDVPS